MRQGFLIGLGSGLVSALLFFSAAHGGPWLGLLLFLLTPLPPLLAGLGWGWLPAAAGAVAGSMAIGAVASLPLGLGYFLAVGLPAAALAYLAYLSRPSDSVAGREWYPAGRLLAVMSLYAGALPVLALPWTGGSFDGLRPLAAEMVRATFKQSGDLRLQSPTDEQVGAFADLVVAVAPSALAVYWLLIMTPNLYLAARIVGASGHLARGWPDLPSLTYPAGFPLLLGLALLAAAFAPGALGVAGTSFTGALLFAHLLAGLALVHFLARRGARWLLWVVYAGLLLPVLSPYAAVLVTAAGLIEPALKLKQRLGAAPPSP
jgi:Predicted membrane protein (DUF2232)